MARYPGARWRPIARNLGTMDRHDGGIDHTYVGSPSPDAAFAHFNVPGTPTPHFMFHRDGTVDQYIDTDRRSSACLDGNHRLITWETADGFPSLWTSNKTQAPPDTPAMVKAKAKLMAWLHKEHGIPLTRMPDSKPTSKGFGWHRLGIDGNFPQKPGQLLGGRVPGGEHWSTSFGKTCPTDTRIHQFVSETLPLAVDLATTPKPGPVNPIEWRGHASLRFDANPKAVANYLVDLLTGFHLTLLTTTESNSRALVTALRKILPDGYKVTRRGEYLIIWQTSTYHARKLSAAVSLLDPRFWLTFGHRRYFRVYRKAFTHKPTGRRFRAEVAHAPRDPSGDKNRLSISNAGLNAWGRQIARYRKRHPHAALVAHLDSNRDQLNDALRHDLEQRLHALSVWSLAGEPSTGSHGAKLYDTAHVVGLTLNRGDAKVVQGDRPPKLDHAAIVYGARVTNP